MRLGERVRQEPSPDVLIKADKARRQSPLYTPFIDAIVERETIDSGRLAKMEEEMVQNVITTPSIVEPTAKEKAVLVGVWRRSLHRKLNDPDLRALTSPLYVCKEDGGWLFSKNSTLGMHGEKGVRMTIEDKLEFFLNREIYSNAQYWQASRHMTSTGRLESWGYRDLHDYDRMSPKTMGKIIKRIRQNGGRLQPQPLVVLDIGSGPGIALTQSRDKVDPHLQLFGLTAEMEPAALPGIEYITAPAELLPRKLLNSCDLIFSNRSFEYFAFPELALRAALLALAPSGEAHINYSYEDSAFNELGLKLRMYLSSLEPNTRVASVVAKRTRKEFDTIRYLSKEPRKYFEIIKLPSGSENDPTSYIGTIQIRKIKEISPEEYLEAYARINGSSEEEF